MTTPPKGKQPLVAKALPANPPLTTQEIPSGGVVSRIQGQGGKTSPAKAPPGGSAQAEAVPANRPEPEPATKEGWKSHLPLIIAAAGGGGLLVLGCIVALVAALVTGRAGTRLAQIPKSANSATVASQTSAVQTIPEFNPDLNGEVGAALLTETAAPTAAVAEKTEPQPPASLAPPAGSSSAPDAAAPMPEPTIQSKPETKTEAKTEAQPALAKVEPPKAAPRPPPKPDPFQGLAKAVKLPELPEGMGQAATDVLSSVELGPCKVDDKASVRAQLKGGSTAVRGGKQKFDLQPLGGTAPRDWEFQILGGETPITIATLSVADGKLLFQWTEEGVKQAATARMLCNCAVELSAGSSQHVIGLRQPATGPPLAIAIDKGGGSGRWLFDNMPELKQVFIEATRFDGLRRHRVEPAEPITPGNDLTVWTGPRDDALFLGLKFSSSSMARGVQMKVSTLLNPEGSTKPQPYSKKDLSSRMQQAEQERAAIESQLKLTSQQPQPKDQKQKADLDAFKNRLQQQMDQRTKAVGRLETLTKYVAEVQGSTAVHFRVYYQADDHQVDLFIAGDPPAPPKGPRRDKAAKADAKK